MCAERGRPSQFSAQRNSWRAASPEEPPVSQERERAREREREGSTQRRRRRRRRRGGCNKMARWCYCARNPVCSLALPPLGARASGLLYAAHTGFSVPYPLLQGFPFPPSRSWVSWLPATVAGWHPSGAERRRAGTISRNAGSCDSSDKEYSSSIQSLRGEHTQHGAARNQRYTTVVTGGFKARKNITRTDSRSTTTDNKIYIIFFK